MFPLLSSCLLPPPCMDCPNPSPKPTIWRKPVDWARSAAEFPTPKKCPSPKTNFHVITQHNLHL